MIVIVLHHAVSDDYKYYDQTNERNRIIMGLSVRIICYFHIYCQAKY